MGFKFENNENQPVVYLAVKYQSLIQPLPDFVDGCKSIEVTNPTTKQTKTKYYRAFAGVEGRITKLSWYENQVPATNKVLRGYKLYLNVDDSDSPTGFTTAVLDLPFKSVAYNTFTKVAENINPEDPLSISVWVNKDQKPVVTFKQGGKSVKYKYTKENMGDCPNGVYSNTLGTWDFSAQLEYLKNVVDTVVLPKFNAIGQQHATTGVIDRSVNEINGSDDHGYGSNPDEDGDDSFSIDDLKY